MEAEEKKLRVLKAEIEASKHSDTAGSSDKVLTRHTQCTHKHNICMHSRYLIRHMLHSFIQAKELETQENNYL